MSTLVSRRQALGGTLTMTAAAATLAMPGIVRVARGAMHPHDGEKAPAGAGGLGGAGAVPMYATRVGTLPLLVVSDGVIPFKPVHPTLGPDVPKALVEAQLADSGLPSGEVTGECNVLVPRDGDRLMLIDTGAGTNFGPGLGKLAARLERAGIDRRAITDVVITHAHPDHIGGCVMPDGSAAFPAARCFISKTEVEFWRGASPNLSGARVEDASRGTFIKAARAGLDAFGGKVEALDSEGAISGSVSFTPLPGHTPGQCGVVIRSGTESLVIAGDTLAHHVLGVADPAVGTVFDTDPIMAVATRRALLDRLATKGERLFAYHITWPGFGRITRSGGQYRWNIEPWVWGEFAV